MPFAEGVVRERELFLECMADPQSKALQHVFFAERVATKVPGLSRDVELKKITLVGVDVFLETDRAGRGNWHFPAADSSAKKAGSFKVPKIELDRLSIENLHLVTYDIVHAKYQDHGAIFFANGQRPAYVNSIAVGKDGTVYTLSRITRNGRTQTDLISIPGPFSRK